MGRNEAKPKGKDLKTNEAISYQEEMDGIMDSSARSLDELAVYEEMTSGLLKELRADLLQKKSPEEILAKYAHFSAARIVTIASTDADSGRALAAAKDVLDRVGGKAVERKQIQHKLQNVDPKQLDAIIISQLEELSIDSDEE